MTERTALHAAHVASGARMVDFAGWEMPLNYGSQIEEHNAVRNKAGMFDVSHMTIIDISGESAASWLRRLVANNVDKLVYYELHTTMPNAIQREKNIKHWSRKWKLDLIEKENPGWRDLYEEITLQ